MSKVRSWYEPLVPFGRYRTYVPGLSIGPWNNTVNKTQRSYFEDRLVVSHGNPGPPYRSGKGFLVKHDSLDVKSIRTGDAWDGSSQYDGVYVCSTIPSVASIPDQSTALFAAGGTAISRARPGDAEASVGQFLVELRDVPRMLAIRHQKSASGIFLNLQFGWAPFFNDLKKMYELQKSIDKTLKQLRRDNGRIIRREYSFPVEQTVSANEFTGTYVSPANGLVPMTHKMHRLSTTVKRQWFSGAFRYYVPDIQSPRWNRHAINNLYGLQPNAELLWQLTPWSWLVDWFGNVGDILHNLQTNAVENLVMKYGYIMGSVENQCTDSVSFKYYGKYPGKSGVSPSQLNGFLATTRKTSVKQREYAFPYGFGPSPGSLSTKQLAILGALGMNRFGRLS